MNIEGKQPSENDKLARVEISSENTVEQDLMSEVGKKSADEHLAGNELIRLWTS